MIGFGVGTDSGAIFLSLLHLIAGRVRQRFFMIEHRTEIAPCRTNHRRLRICENARPRSMAVRWFAFR
jgi:hypothetical protein